MDNQDIEDSSKTGDELSVERKDKYIKELEKDIETLKAYNHILNIKISVAQQATLEMCNECDKRNTNLCDESCPLRKVAAIIL